MNLRHRVVATLPFLLLLGACSEEPQPAAKKEVKPAEPVAAVTAVYQMYKQARGWAPDCLLLQVSSLDVKEVKGQEGGKMAAWEATFASPKLRQSRRFTYSVVEVPASNLPEGVFGSSPDTWSPVGQTQLFQIQYLKTDSTAAFITAMTKAKDYAAKHPDMPVKFLLEWQKRHLNPTWRVYWGESVATSGFSVYVDAMFDKYLSIAH
ncbi:MAG: hypothetical protein ABSH46_13860 [Bryobacteraceae bacterium]|jgi:hypothetical protein